MCSDFAISADNLTKTYRLFDHPGDRIKQALTLGQVHFHQEFTALRNISFRIPKGDIVGIIGRNGSGKSTLLQLVCGILKPTAGKITVNGRISALLELGAGFNPEFTGRENVYFQGALMGLPKTEIGQRLGEIIAFADIGNFIDRPVRSYSSGMYLRLAFAAAVNFDPEILVVDEALAVGDAGFRSRCFRRIGELRARGCTVLFVSHAMDQIVKLCGQAMLIDEGELLLVGQPGTIVKQYHRLVTAGPGARQAMHDEIKGLDISKKSSASISEIPAPEPDDAEMSEFYDHRLRPDTALGYEPNGALIEAVEVLTLSGEKVNQLVSGRTYRCVYRISFVKSAVNVRCSMLIKNSAHIALGGTYSAPTPADGIPNVLQSSTADVEFEFDCMLNPGNYFLSVAVFGSIAGIEYALHGITEAERFRVVADARRSTIADVDFRCRAAIQIANPRNQR